MPNTPENHRAIIKNILEENVYKHQILAAENTFDGLLSGARAVILAAEMQGGKSGVALALASLQRMGLSDQEITDRNKLKDTLYVMTMADTELLDQAERDLAPAKNAVVTNLTRFSKSLDQNFQYQDPKLIIVDECHYGSGDNAVRYDKLFDYIENENKNCKIVFISATPLSALLATENDSIIRRDIKTKLVFHRTSDDYRGVREMFSDGQIKSINGRTRNILNRSKQRDQFLEAIKNYQGTGWALIRVGSGSAMNAKSMLIRQGIDEANIYILGKSLTGVPIEDHTEIERFKSHYEEAKIFGEKLIAITVAGCRAGINFGKEMKETLIASWDSTVSNLAAVVQANIGRACGYHSNKDSLHFTNIHAVQAYGELLDYLESQCSDTATDDLDGLRIEYERIAKKYDLKGFDVGAAISRSNINQTKKIVDTDIYLTDFYIPVPGMLTVENPDYSAYTDDPVVLDAIDAVREAYLKGGRVDIRPTRTVNTRCRDIMINSWVNGDTYDNREKAMAEGTIRERITDLTNAMDNDEPVIFNNIIKGGGGVKASKKEVAVFILSIFNTSRRKNIKKPRLTPDDMSDLCNWFNIPYDDTLMLIFKKGQLDDSLTLMMEKEVELIKHTSPIIEGNKFQKQVSI